MASASIAAMPYFHINLMAMYMSISMRAIVTALKAPDLIVSPTDGPMFSTESTASSPMPNFSPSALTSAVLNDVDGELAFARQVCGYGQAGDVLLAISTSGKAENLAYASVTAHAKGMKVILLTGKDGGKCRAYADVSVIVPDYKKSGETVIPTELKYVEVIAVTAKSGYDANTEERVRAEEKKDGDGEAKELPSTVTVLVTPEQGKILAMLEAEQEMHLSLVYRGDEKNAGKFIDAQDAVLEEIKVALEEAEKQDVWEGLEGRVIGESGTTILSGTKKGSRAVITGNRIIGMPLPADASLGADEARTTGELIGGK